MKVIPKFTSKITLAPGTVGEVLNYEVRHGEVYFRVIWYGRPGIAIVHHAEVEVPQ